VRFWFDGGFGPRNANWAGQWGKLMAGIARRPCFQGAFEEEMRDWSASRLAEVLEEDAEAEECRGQGEGWSCLRRRAASLARQPSEAAADLAVGTDPSNAGGRSVPG